MITCTVRSVVDYSTLQEVSHTALLARNAARFSAFLSFADNKSGVLGFGSSGSGSMQGIF